MAQVFPAVGTEGGDDALPVLTRILAGLPEDWTLLRDQQIGGDEAASADIVLIHPEIGIALVSTAPRQPDSAAVALRDYLASERFGEYFPGELPIVPLGIPEAEAGSAGERLAAAFEAAPRLTIGDPDWADAVIELLLVPGETTIPEPAIAAPASEIAPSASALPALAAPSPEEPPLAAAEGWTPAEPEAAADTVFVSEPPREPVRDFPIALTAGERLADEDLFDEGNGRRRRGWVIGLAAAASLLLAVGLGAWVFDEGASDTQIAREDSAPARLALPTTPPSTTSPTPPATSAATATGGTASKPAVEPPPVPPSPVTMFAARPMLPPPAWPRPPAVAPLPTPPRVAETVSPAPTAAAKSPGPPPATSPAPSLPAPPPTTVATASPPPPQPALAPGAAAKSPSTPPATSTASSQPAPPTTVAAASPPPAAPPPSATPTPTAPAPATKDEPAAAISAGNSPSAPPSANPAPPPAAPAAAHARPARPTPPRERQQAAATKPPRPAAPERQASEPPRRGARPPIDAADLTPIEEADAGTTAPRAEPPPPPSQSGGIAAPRSLLAPWRPTSATQTARADTTTSPWSAEAGGNPATARQAGGNQECRPYTADTTLAGRSQPVQGIACRGADGNWRLVSETPRR